MLSIIESLTTSFAQAQKKRILKRLHYSLFKYSCYLFTARYYGEFGYRFSTHQLFDSTDEFKGSRGYGSK